MLGAAVAYARASRRQGFIDRQDPATLYGVPLIGEIPAFDEKKALRSNGSATRGLPVSADPHSAVAEAFRFAAGSIERIRAERGPRLSLVFVSPLADAGKSMVVANLALAIAEGGTRVLAVDADTGDGGLTARLLPGIQANGGLEQVLAGELPLPHCIQPSPLSAAVAVLGSGPALHPRVTGAARSKAASALLATAKSSFDVVLIDSPGLLQVADATELVGACRRCDHRPRPRRADPGPRRDSGPAQAHRVRCRRLHLLPSADAAPARPIPAPRFIGSPDGFGSLSRGLSDSLPRHGHLNGETVRPLSRRTGKAPCRRLC